MADRTISLVHEFIESWLLMIVALLNARNGQLPEPVSGEYHATETRGH